MKEIVREMSGKLKWQFVFNLRVVINLQNGSMKIVSFLFLKSKCIKIQGPYSQLFIFFIT